MPYPITTNPAEMTTSNAGILLEKLWKKIEFVIHRGRRLCNWSTKAFDKIMAAGHNVNIIPITKAEIEMLQNDEGVNYLPMIYHGEHFIGSYDDLMTLLETLENKEK